jgi:hypothetical protein
LDYATVIDTLDQQFDDVRVFLFEDFIANKETRREFFLTCSVEFSDELLGENVDTPQFSATLYYLNKLFPYK